MISFRVSEDEYAGLKTLCIHQGARSISDMARDAVNRLMTDHTWPNHSNHQLLTVVQVIQGRIEALDREVQRLGQALNGRAVHSGPEKRNGDESI
jgi:hypothetical protein